MSTASVPRMIPDPRWTRYLTVVVALLVGFGALLVLAPVLVEAAFGRMIFGPGGFPGSFGDEERGYVHLAHAVIGAVMVGWFTLMLWVAGAALPRGVPGAWPALVTSVAVWFVLDTAFSLVTGYWQNAVLNTALLLALLPGLLGTRPR